MLPRQQKKIFLKSQLKQNLYKYTYWACNDQWSVFLCLWMGACPYWSVKVSVSFFFFCELCKMTLSICNFNACLQQFNVLNNLRDTKNVKEAN